MLESMETPPEPPIPERRSLSPTDFAEGVGALMLFAASRNALYEQQYFPVGVFAFGAVMLTVDIIRRWRP